MTTCMIRVWPLSAFPLEWQGDTAVVAIGSDSDDLTRAASNSQGQEQGLKFCLF